MLTLSKKTDLMVSCHDHKDIAYDEGSTKKGPYLLLDKIIKTGSKIAINISEKI